jgi:formate-dependent nitrite reductase membrane component NrfD
MVRRPEKEAAPGVFYLGAHQATLDPLAARRPDGGLYAWATQGAPDPQLVVSGHPDRPTSSAAALVSYDVPHYAPWGWRVSLYTWTKSVAAGLLVVAAALALLGLSPWSDAVTSWVAPLGTLIFLGITGLLLIWDLKHPFRFYLIFTRRQWRSWLVRGSFILAGYGGAVVCYLGSVLLGAHWLQVVFGVLAIPLGLATACYTAYLFAQAKARDMWQSPLLPVHLAVQAVLAGAAGLLPFVALTAGTDTTVSAIEITLSIAAVVHVLLIWGEVTLPHVTAHAHLAVHEMTRGRFARTFWAGIVLVCVAVAAPWLGWVVAPFALLGLLAHEHAFVQAGQSVPLA